MKTLVATLRTGAMLGPLELALVDDSIRVLKENGFAYRNEKFPTFEHDIPVAKNVPMLPTNSAEALLWKLGRWKAYQLFVKFRLEPDKKPPRSGVVFYAYARHLSDRQIPIYDQHALRAIWGICQLTPKEFQSCRQVLMNRQKKWKESGTGKQGMICYELFKEKFTQLRAAQVSSRKLDSLLMPLGQALKKLCGTHAQFLALIRN